MIVSKYYVISNIEKADFRGREGGRKISVSALG